MADAIAMLGYRFDPLVAEWFEGKFGLPTEPQREGWKAIGSGEDVLISAPTGSGKTLAAFLICLDRLVKVARTGDLADRTVAVYVSPLKALSSDIARNLEAPLAEIRELAGKRGVSLQPIRTALRTGDTPASDRRKLITRPPHILITTPESLFILLTAAHSREVLKTAGTVIVDEIHAVAGNKRGSHLSLSLARLERLSEAGQDRATSLEVADRSFWECAQRLALARQIYPGTEARPAIGAVPPVRPLPAGIESSIAEMLRGWFDSVGPRTAASCASCWCSPKQPWGRRWPSWRARVTSSGAASATPAGRRIWNGVTGGCWLGSTGARCARDPWR